MGHLRPHELTRALVCVGGDPVVSIAVGIAAIVINPSWSVNSWVLEGTRAEHEGST